MRLNGTIRTMLRPKSERRLRSFCKAMNSQKHCPKSLKKRNYYRLKAEAIYYKSNQNKTGPKARFIFCGFRSI